MLIYFDTLRDNAVFCHKLTDRYYASINEAEVDRTLFHQHTWRDLHASECLVTVSFVRDSLSFPIYSLATSLLM